MSRLLRLFPFAFVLLSCASPIAGPAPQAQPDSRPNIVLIVADDQHYRDFGFMGSEVAKTPNLDRLAHGGTLFPNGYSTSSTCRPALASLLTGLYPHQWQARVRRLLRSEAIPDERFAFVDFATLPRVLSNAGYATFQAGKYWEGTYEMGGFSEGMTRELGSGGTFAPAGGEGLHLVRQTMEPVYDFIRSHRDEPFFLWFSPPLPHLPHDAPARYRELYRDDDLDASELGYYANIAWLDEGIGSLVDFIDSLGLSSSTLIVFVVDNGWTTGTSHFGGEKGKGTLHEAGYRTPIFFHWKERVPEGAVRDSLVSIVDLFPTLLAYAEAPVPEARPGFNMQPAIEGSAKSVREVIVGNQPVLSILHGGLTQTKGQFLRTDRLHLIVQEVGLFPELYDIANDPDEEKNVASQNRPLVRALWKLMREQISRDLKMLRN